MPELLQSRAALWHEIAKVRVSALAGRQWGRVTVAQLEHLGVARSTVRNWTRTGYLHRMLPRVYAVGHTASSREAELFAAVLYAGPGAALSHLSAAWWYRLIEFPGPVIHVCSPHRRRPLPGIVVHHRRDETRIAIRGMPVTTRAQALLDLAASTPDLVLVHKALGRIEYAEGMLDVSPLREICSRGRPGSAALMHALDGYDPLLARANGPLAERFHLFCAQRLPAHGLALPEIEVTVHGVDVDVHFPDHRLVVELDGDRNHRTPAQRRRDMRREAILRAHGIATVRYDWGLIEQEPELVERDLLSTLARRDPARVRGTDRA